MSNLALTMLAKRFDAEHLHYEILDDQALRVKVQSTGYESDVVFVFEDDCSEVKIMAFNFAHVPEEKMDGFYKVLNELNLEYKHVCFALREDGIIVGSDDDFITLDTCAEECFRLMWVMLHVIDDAYPRIMKAIWA